MQTSDAHQQHEKNHEEQIADDRDVKGKEREEQHERDLHGKNKDLQLSQYQSSYKNIIGMKPIMSINW